MSFTRFHDDPCRIAKQLEESTNQGKYIMNVPGNGLTPYYMEDPYIRLQKWGGNLSRNSVNLESDLRGLTRNLTRDHINKNSHTEMGVKQQIEKYPINGYQTEQSRATHPAWLYIDAEQTKNPILFLNPHSLEDLKILFYF